MLNPVLFKIAAVWYSLSSIVLFMLYGLDKAQAVAEGRRIPESTLHSLAILGGFLGGFAGRSIFNHKTRKPVFLIILTGSTAAHIIHWALVIFIYS